MIVVSLFGLLAAIAIPNFVHARNASFKTACINNLRQIDSALHQWALENKKVDTDIAQTSDLAPYIKYSTFPKCPVGGTYSTASATASGTFRVGEPITCTVAGHIQPAP